MLQIVINILLVIHVAVSLLLLLVVLMQRPKSEGLGSAFGGGMTEDLFGAQTTTVLTKVTVYLGGAFFALTLTLAILYAQRSRADSGLQQELARQVEAVPASDAGQLPVTPESTDGETVQSPEMPASEDSETVEEPDTAGDASTTNPESATDDAAEPTDSDAAPDATESTVTNEEAAAEAAPASSQ